MNVYVVSVMAFSPIVEGSISVGTYCEHIPALIPAESIEDAAENAKNFALDKWKISEGWTGHQAGIKSVTKEFYDAALDALEAGKIDDADSVSEERTFQFSPNAQDIFNKGKIDSKSEFNH